MASNRTTLYAFVRFHAMPSAAYTKHNKVLLKELALKNIYLSISKWNNSLVLLLTQVSLESLTFLLSYNKQHTLSSIITPFFLSAFKRLSYRLSSAGKLFKRTYFGLNSISDLLRLVLFRFAHIDSLAMLSFHRALFFYRH